MSNYQQAPQQQPQAYDWLKEELEQEEQRIRNAQSASVRKTGNVNNTAIPTITYEQMKDVLEEKTEAANMTAVGVWLCIFCPSILMSMVVKAEEGIGFFGEDAASGIGILFLFLMIGIAVYLFIRAEQKKKKANKQLLGFYQLSEDARAYLLEQKAVFDSYAPKMTAISTVMLIFSFVPLVVAGVFMASDAILVNMVGWMLALIATGTYGLVRINEKKTIFRKYIGK